MRSDHTRFFAAAAFLAGVVVLGSGTAHAFCRTTTIAPPADFEPTQGATGATGDACWPQGAPLYWANACIGYSLQQDASRQVDLATASRVVDQSFNTWNAAACSGGAAAVDGGAAVDAVAPKPTPVMGPSIRAGQVAGASCDVVGYSVTGPNQNLVVFRDDVWPHNDAAETLGLVTLTFDAQTGEIYDADMEINSKDYALTTADPVPANGYDLRTILTHEAGHFLGLAHSASPDAAMFPVYIPGTATGRDLAEDDVAAICAVYTPSGERSTAAGLVAAGPCDTTPRHGFSADCPAPQPTTNGWTCATSTAGAAASPLAGRLALSMALMATLVCVRRRRRTEAARS